MTADATETLLTLIDSGCSPTQALDYYMTQVAGFTNQRWADRTGRSESTIAANLTYARQTLDDEIDLQEAKKRPSTMEE